MAAMNTFMAIRKRLNVTQAEIAAPLGVTQSNVSFYEKGQTVPPAVAGRLIEFAKAKGLTLTFDEIYGAAKKKATGAPAIPSPATQGEV